MQGRVGKTAGLEEELTKDWWLRNFGFFVEPMTTEEPLLNGMGILTWKVWTGDKFHLAYGEDVGKLWNALQGEV